MAAMQLAGCRLHTFMELLQWRCDCQLQDKANLTELRTFLYNQFEQLRADLQQQYAVADSLRQQLSHEIRQSALLQQQLQNSTAMHQHQLAEIAAAHGSELAAANGKIGSLIGQVRQLSLERNVFEAQLAPMQAANAQQARQLDQLQRVLQHTRQQLATATAEKAAATGAPAEHVEQTESQAAVAGGTAVCAES